MSTRTARDERLTIFREQVRAFTTAELVPRLPHWEALRSLPPEAYRLLADAGLTGLQVPRPLGGAGRDIRFSAVVTEELSRGGATAPCTSLLAISNTVCPLLATHGSDAQQKRWLGPIIRGACIASIAVTEPAGGSDLARSVQTRARATGDGWVLNGEKLFITNAPVADVLLVLARTHGTSGLLGMTLFVVPTACDGVSVMRLDKLGLHASPTGTVRLRNCHVPTKALLGVVDRGYFHVAALLEQERLLAAIAAPAIARACIELALDANPGLRRSAVALHQLAVMLAQAEAGRAFAWSLVETMRRGDANTTGIALAKAALGDFSRRVSATCRELGSVTEGPATAALERMARDTRAISVFAGSSETMRELAGTRIVAAARRKRASFSVA